MNFINVFLVVLIAQFGLSAGCGQSLPAARDSLAGRARDARIAPEGGFVEMPTFFVLPEHVIEVEFLIEKLSWFKTGLGVAAFPEQYALVKTVGDYAPLKDAVVLCLSAVKEAFKALMITSPVSLKRVRGRVLSCALFL